MLLLVLYRLSLALNTDNIHTCSFLECYQRMHTDKIFSISIPVMFESTVIIACRITR